MSDGTTIGGGAPSEEPMPVDDLDVPVERPLPGVLVSQSIAELTATLRALNENTSKMASKEYVEEWQREQDQKRRRFVQLVVAGGAAILIIMALMGFTLYKVYDIAQSAEDNTQQIIDCTAPSVDPHSCFAERRKIQEDSQQAETEKIIDQITTTIADRVADKVTKEIERLLNRQP